MGVSGQGRRSSGFSKAGVWLPSLVRLPGLIMHPRPSASLVARAEAPVLFINFNLRNVVGNSLIKM